MTITVSISEFRRNLSDYLEQAAAGHMIVLKNKKKNEEIVQIVTKKNFDMAQFKKTLKVVAGTFTAERHPEWRTKRDVIKWVEEGRKAADRTF